jgi:Leucine-rich repeat (LRR) protein
MEPAGVGRGYKGAMALVETLTLTVGNAVAKWIFGAWLGDGLPKELAGSFTDTVTAKIPEGLQRRRLLRQAEQVAERTAGKLAGVIEAEFFSVPLAEQKAAARAVAATLEYGLAAVDPVALDLDPLRLKRALLDRHAPGTGLAGLSPDGRELYDLVLAESAAYIVEVVATLPRTTPAGIAELLRRETALIDMVSEILEQMPHLQDAAGAARTGDREFETNYLRLVARRLDRLELFGVSVSEMSSRYALSVAYITLMAQNRTVPGQGQGDPLRVDDAIANRRRVFLRGVAGSGKTTLLQWLAVRSARNGFDGNMRDWNDSVPFFIQLRRFTPGALPQPREFLRHVADPIAETAPDDWVPRLLSSGRAIVLVDGVDEVPEAGRRRVKDWLEGLTIAYPQARFVVTSRPVAVSDEWLDDDDFAVLDLQPMAMSDIEEFVVHWHLAVRRGSDPDDDAELGRYQAALIDTIRSNRQIRNLATTPLLCAVICALNRDRHTKLPRDRTELYRIALEMLLERRDVERETPAATDEAFGFPERRIILRDLAFWLVVNEQADVTREVTLGRFAKRLRDMPGQRIDAESVLRFMLERSGVLREPVPGRIDFLHKTFQEYLAAIEVCEQDHIPMLIKKAIEADWRDVVVLAAGVGHSSQKAQLLEGLLKRGRAERRNRHRLFLMAVACLETAREVPKKIADEIQQCLHELVPPTSLGIAATLASAGELVLPRLPHHGLRANAAAACIRTAALVGGRKSLAVLEKYARDRRVTVQRELIYCWGIHDLQDEYAERVLADLPLVDGVLTLKDSAFLEMASSFRHLTDLRLTVRGEFPNRDALRQFPQLTSFEATGNASVADLSFLSGNTALTSLNLDGCTEVKSLRPLAGLTHLRHLRISGFTGSDVSELAGFRDLETLVAPGCRSVKSWRPLHELDSLRFGDFAGCEQLTSTALSSNWSRLTHLDLTGTAVGSLQPLAGATALEYLFLADCQRLKGIGALSGHQSLRELDLQNHHRYLDLAELTELPVLEWVGLNLSSQLTGFDIFGASPGLRAFHAAGCPKLTRISFLAAKRHLREVDLSYTAVRDLSPLASCKALESVTLRGPVGRGNLEPLAGLRSLRRIDLSHNADVDLHQLVRVPQSRITVTLSHGQRPAGLKAFLAAGGTVQIAQE